MAAPLRNEPYNVATSLSLSAYLAFARREGKTLPKIDQPRPIGTLLWLHCSEPVKATALAQLGLRLAQQRGNTEVLLTLSPGRRLPKQLPNGVIYAEAPSENPSDVKVFLDHWKPTASIWIGPWLRPSLQVEAADRGIPMFLLDADEPGLESKRWRWLPDSLRTSLALFTRIFASNAAAGFRLRKTIGSDSAIEDSGQILEDSPALKCNATDLEDLSEALKARPSWLAARILPAELSFVLHAHKTTSKISPRLLLIIVPEHASDAVDLREKCIEAGWRVGSWDDGEVPDEKMEILIAENTAELGLFYRIAPITLMGCSLVSGQGGRNPFEPAALGSAVLYGPGVRNHLDAYSRLARAGGARIVRDAETLSAALSRLMAPDQVAQMVHAGWETVSEGAIVVDRVVECVNEALDEKGAN